jgi:SAM-dependent methyltransferase
MQPPVEHVPEASLGPTLAFCPLCRAEQPRATVVTLQDEPQVNLLQCTTCGGRSASRLPTPEFLAELYNPSHYHSDLLDNPHATRRLARHIASFLSEGANKPMRILDFGGSDGRLSLELDRALRQVGPARHEYVVVDLHARPAAPPLRFVDLEAFWSMQENFDVVLASAVIEHLPNLRQVVERLLQLRATSSVFYARTPCDAPLQRLFPGYRVRWPRHLHDLGPEFWSRFTSTFHCGGRLVHSAPSVIESDFMQHPVRSLAAFAMKLPGHFETRLVQPLLGYTIPKWDLVGGWEVVIRTP